VIDRLHNRTFFAKLVIESHEGKEILDDTIRASICPHKLNVAEWCSIIMCAHALGIPSTATMLFGHIEEADHIVKHFTTVREIQKHTGMFTEFIPLPFMPHNTHLGQHYHISSVDIERVKQITACARIFFYNTIRNIQTSWVKLGLDNALDCLRVGANDVGGTLYEENITRCAGGTHGQYVAKERFIDGIRGRGKTPVIRDTLYSFQNEKSVV